MNNNFDNVKNVEECINEVSLKDESKFDNWVILCGEVVSEPVKVFDKDNIFYNFRIDNQKFKMNCTITLFEDNKDIEDNIFRTLKLGNIVKVSGKLFMKKKDDRLWVQINVKNWVHEDGEKKVLYKI